MKINSKKSGPTRGADIDTDTAYSNSMMIGSEKSAKKPSKDNSLGKNRKIEKSKRIYRRTKKENRNESTIHRTARRIATALRGGELQPLSDPLSILENANEERDVQKWLLDVAKEYLFGRIKFRNLTDFKAFGDSYLAKCREEGEYATMAGLSLALGLDLPEFVSMCDGERSTPCLIRACRQYRAYVQDQAEKQLIRRKSNEWLARYGDRRLERDAQHSSSSSMQITNAVVQIGISEAKNAKNTAFRSSE